MTNSNGTFIKIKKKFRNLNELIAFYKNNNYYDCYYSISKFLNPANVKAKSEEKEFDSFFLGMDLFFDIDANYNNVEKNIQETQSEVFRLLDYANIKGWKLNYIAFSGSKGFHLCFRDITDYKDCFLPKEREEKAQKQRKEIINELKNQKIKFDERITADTRRIVRVPFTYNSKTGYMCTILDLKMLEMKPEELLKEIPHNINYIRAESLLTKAMKKVKNFPLIRGVWSALGHALKKFELLDVLNSKQYPSYVLGISSNCKKNHVLVLQIKRINKQLIDVIDSIKIPYCIVKSDRLKFLISPILFEYNKYTKIAKLVNSYSYVTLKKYKHTVFMMDYLDYKFRKIKTCKKILYSNFNGYKELIDKIHVNFDYQFSSSHAIVFSRFIKEAENNDLVKINYFENEMLTKMFKEVKAKLILRILKHNDDEQL
ncbi:MAG: hypothetical protein N3E37_04485 [Candidatus Micrarchaeota archaeon]|nr:hypothetical protein [Candidatus Micrarchaeota archaeon]